MDAITGISGWVIFSWENYTKICNFGSVDSACHSVSSNPFNFINVHSLHPAIHSCKNEHWQVKWITAHNCGEPKMTLIQPTFSWKRKIWTSSLSHKMCPRKQTTEPKLLILVHFSHEKVPYPLIPVNASTYYGKCAVPFLLGHPVLSEIWSLGTS